MTTFEHDALLYSGTADFVEHLLPFVREGLEQEDGVLVVTTPTGADALRDALGADAPQVDCRDAATWYATPGKAFRGYADYLSALPSGRRLRAVGEPLWPVGSPEAVAEWARYEAALNVAFAQASAWIVCPYDTSSLPDEILEHARRAHPALHARGERHEHGRFVDPPELAAELDRVAPLAPPAQARRLPVTHDLAALRAAVGEAAAAAGVRRLRVAELLIAVHELAINALTHGGGEAELTTWVDGPDFVCEVGDSGPGLADAFAGYAVPPEEATRGRGFWIARQLCDLVEIRSGPNGTRVRVRVPRA